MSKLFEALPLSWAAAIGRRARMNNKRVLKKRTNTPPVVNNSALKYVKEQVTIKGNRETPGLLHMDSRVRSAPGQGVKLPAPAGAFVRLGTISFQFRIPAVYCAAQGHSRCTGDSIVHGLRWTFLVVVRPHSTCICSWRPWPSFESDASRKRVREETSRRFTAVLICRYEGIRINGFLEFASYVDSCSPPIAVALGASLMAMTSTECLGTDVA